MCSTHRTVAAAVTIVEVGFIPAPLPVQALLLALGIHAGAWPDYDTPGSTPSRELGPVSQAVSATVRFVAYAVQAPTGDREGARTEGVHRRFTHTVEACLLAGLLVWYATASIGLLASWSVWFGLVAFTGAFSHVVLGDNFTPHGVPLCLTYNMLTRGSNWRRHGWTLATTDHPSEHLVFMLAVRVLVMVAVVVALRLPVTPHVLVAAALLGAGWHLLVLTGLLRKAMR